MTDHDLGLTRKDLQKRNGTLSGTSWGLFSNPWRGTPSIVDSVTTQRAVSEVRSGEVFGLDYAIDTFVPGMSKTRKAPEHHIFGNHPAHRDDYLDAFYLQGSTQIDGLRHRRADDVGFYAGVPDEQIGPGTEEIGIQVWAEDPIATRGVLIDLDGYLRSAGNEIDHVLGQPITMDMIQSALSSQRIELRRGDIAMLHTGWCEWFLGLDSGAKAAQQESRRSTGLAQTQEVLDWAWDTGLSVLAADNFAVECLPPLHTSPFKDSAPNDKGMMHQEFLAKLGLPLGELWKLGPLARRMRVLDQWHALVTVKPLNVVGGTGSPANAMAIL